MKIDVINALCDLGVDVDGASLGPKKLKEKIINNEYINNIIDVFCDCSNKDHNPDNLEKNYDRLIEYTTTLYNTLINSKNNGNFSITIGGDHSIAVSSALASIKKEDNLGIIWIDAHADYNTFETTITGNLHGLPLATIDGLNNRLSLFHDGNYYDPKKTVIVGYRSEEVNKEEEINNLKDAGVTFFTTEELNTIGIENVISKAFKIASNNGNNKVHVSYDLDFIDPNVAPGVSIPEVNGPTKEQAISVCKNVLNYINNISSFDIVEFNPLNDIDDKTLNIALEIFNLVIESIKTIQK